MKASLSNKFASCLLLLVLSFSIFAEQHRMAIIGAGAAGIFTAYELNKQYPGKYRIDIFERNEKIGGNVSSVSVDYGGEQYTLDAGAQFFGKNAQPNHYALIKELGLESQIRTYATGLTIWDGLSKEHLFWIPAKYEDFLKYSLQDWKRIVEFIAFLVAAERLNARKTPDWSLTVDDFLESLPDLLVSDDFKQNVIKNFIYQFVTMPYDQIGKASALYATSYFIRNVIKSKLLSFNTSVFEVSQSLVGLSGILDAALKASGAAVHTKANIISVEPQGSHVQVRQADGRTERFDYVVLAGSPVSSGKLLRRAQVKPALKAILKNLAAEYTDLSIIMQKDNACWMPEDSKYWTSVNTVVNPNKELSFSVWFGPLRPSYDQNKLVPAFKSWGTPDLPSGQCSGSFYSHKHQVFQPTVAFMQQREKLKQWQGEDGIFFAGGWTNWFDSQESALISAKRIVKALGDPVDKGISEAGDYSLPDGYSGDSEE